MSAYMKKLKWVILMILLAAGITVGLLWMVEQPERTYRGTFVMRVPAIYHR